MSVGMSILAILNEGPSYGLELRNEFESRTGGIWPLNVGQVYTTIDRLERDDLVRQTEENEDGQKIYAITPAGRARLRDWFAGPGDAKPPARDELVLKLVMAARGNAASPGSVIQAERKAALQLLQQYTRLKADATETTDLGWLFLVDSLIFQTEARVRWLDACETRIARAPAPAKRKPAKTKRRTEVRR